MRRAARHATLFLSSALLLSCDKVEDPLPPTYTTPLPSSTTQVTQLDGGIATSRDGKLALEIFANTLTENATIKITEGVATPAPNAAIGKTYNVEVTPASAVPTMGFNADLTFTVTTAELGSTNPSTVSVISGGSVGTPITEWPATYPTTIATGYEFATNATHFSYFGLIDSNACDYMCELECECNTCTCDTTSACESMCECDQDCYGCDCDYTSGCDTDCSCDPDCSSCSCDYSGSCDPECSCDPDCINCSCDYTGSCDPDCSCDTDCTGCSCDYTSACDADCICDPDCSDPSDCAVGLCMESNVGMLCLDETGNVPGSAASCDGDAPCPSGTAGFNVDETTCLCIETCGSCAGGLTCGMLEGISSEACLDGGAIPTGLTTCDVTTGAGCGFSQFPILVNDGSGDACVCLDWC